MVLNATPEEQEQYRALNRLRMKTYRDKKRVRKYSPRTTRSDKRVQVNEGKKDE
jgi:hypothetical protein